MLNTSKYFFNSPHIGFKGLWYSTQLPETKHLLPSSIALQKAGSDSFISLMRAIVCLADSGIRPSSAFSVWGGLRVSCSFLCPMHWLFSGLAIAPGRGSAMPNIRRSSSFVKSWVSIGSHVSPSRIISVCFMGTVSWRPFFFLWFHNLESIYFFF